MIRRWIIKHYCMCVQVFGEGVDVSSAVSASVTCVWASHMVFPMQGASRSDLRTDLVAAGNSGGQVALVSANCGVLFALWQAHPEPITAISAQGTLLYTCTSGSSVKVRKSLQTQRWTLKNADFSLTI